MRRYGKCEILFFGELKRNVVAWGRNTENQCNVPENLMNVVSIAVGFDHSLALTDGGEVVGWGSNSNGQINIPNTLMIGVSCSSSFSWSVCILSSLCLSFNSFIRFNTLK